MFEPAPLTSVAQAEWRQLRAQRAGQAGADASNLSKTRVELLGSKQSEPFLGRCRLDLVLADVLAATQAHLNFSELPEQPGAR